MTREPADPRTPPVPPAAFPPAAFPLTPTLPTPTTPCPGEIPGAQDPRLRAVLERRAWRGTRFVYGVRTTGIACRPGCPSPRPRAENVRLFPDLEAACAAGYRPCKRCRPELADPADPDSARVVRTCRRIEAGPPWPSLAQLARAESCSADHLRRLFARATGLTPGTYAEALRDARLRSGLAGAGTVTEAALEAGFGSLSRFYERAPSALGMAPARARRGGAGERLRVALGRTDLGAVLVAASERGVCHVALGDEPLDLLLELEQRLPRARFEVGDEAFEVTVSRVLALCEVPRFAHELPLDLRGTAFQVRVWEALRRVPPGEPWTYTRLAQEVGAARAVRAVAGACAANRVALLVPCHRIVRRDGELGGFRWGVERKARLLERERGAPGTAEDPLAAET